MSIIDNTSFDFDNKILIFDNKHPVTITSPLSDTKYCSITGDFVPFLLKSFKRLSK